MQSQRLNGRRRRQPLTDLAGSSEPCHRRHNRPTRADAQRLCRAKYRNQRKTQLEVPPLTALCPRVHSGTASSSCARPRPGAFLVLLAAALFAGTLGYAELIDDHQGVKEAGTMLESAMLSVGAGYVFKYAAGRERPDQTSNPNR